MKYQIINTSKKSKFKTSSMIEHPKITDRIIDIVVIILVALVAFCSFIPMWHVLMCSISDGELLLTHKGVAWLPVGQINLKGYAHLFESGSGFFDNEIVKGYLNTILYTVTTTLLGFFISVTGGYAMSRTTKYKKYMILFVMITMLFGGGLIPTYMVIRALGWVGTPFAVIIPGCTNAMFLIMMMNAFHSVPNEIYEAARIDGASQFRTMFQIMLPQAKNMSAVIILNSVVGVWNSWFSAQVYLSNNKNLWPLQLFIKEMVSNNKDFLQSSTVDFSRYLIQYSSIVIASLPIIILFPFFQDKLEKGVIGGGVKG